MDFDISHDAAHDGYSICNTSRLHYSGKGKPTALVAFLKSDTAMVPDTENNPAL